MSHRYIPHLVKMSRPARQGSGRLIRSLRVVYSPHTRESPLVYQYSNFVHLNVVTLRLYNRPVGIISSIAILIYVSTRPKLMDQYLS
jgi:hypothetical protein